jgi:hypothetical protein
VEKGSQPSGTWPSRDTAIFVQSPATSSTFGASAALAMTHRAPPRSIRSRRSAGPAAVVVGMMTAPSFMMASMDSHSSTWLPSMTMTESPLPTP